MQKITERWISYGILGFIPSFLFNMWWQINAPYCCLNQCGQTVYASTCMPGLLANMGIILSITAIAMGVYIEIR